MKILQIVESLHKGAVENWLVRIFIETQKHRSNWEWTFFCIIDAPGDLDNLVLENGGIIIKSRFAISNKILFLKNLREQIRTNNYDIIHAHHDYLNSFYAMAFWRSRALKISHIHNTDQHLPVGNRRLNTILIPPLKLLNNILFSKLIGISQDTIKEFKYSFSSKWSDSILYYGIDLTKFNTIYNRDLILDSFKIPNNKKVLLFLGRFTKLKNPSFLIPILKELVYEFGDDYYALFIGEGDELHEINKKVEELKLSERVRIINWVKDPEKYFQIADFFIFPRALHPIEGFGMVMLEAQASGIPILTTKGVPSEAIVIKEIVHIIDDLTDSKKWANKIIEISNRGRISDAIRKLENSKFDITNSTLQIIQLYDQHKFKHG